MISSGFCVFGSNLHVCHLAHCVAHPYTHVMLQNVRNAGGLRGGAAVVDQELDPDEVSARVCLDRRPIDGEGRGGCDNGHGLTRLATVPPSMARRHGAPA